MSDDAPACLCVARRQGLMRALEMVYPWVAHQLCWVHKMWNVLGKVRKVDHEGLKRGLRAIYEARSRKAALEAYLRWARRWRGILRSCSTCFRVLPITGAI